MAALAPSFLPGGRSALASARGPSSPPGAALGPVRQLGRYWGPSPEGVRLLLGEEEAAPEAGGWEAGKAGCVQAVPEFSCVSGNKSLRPCPCQIPHLVKNKGEESACPRDDVKVFGMAVAMLLLVGIQFWQGPRRQVGTSNPAMRLRPEAMPSCLPGWVQEKGRSPAAV